MYYLYGFDLINDMIVDRMYFVFNMLKWEFLDKLWFNVEENINEDVNDCDLVVGGLFVYGDFSEVFKYVKWIIE